MADPPPVTGISELVLEVSDLDAARRFYRDVLGFEETLYGEGAEGRYWYLVGETARLGLWTEQVGLAGGRGGAHVHYAFSVPDGEIDRLKERIEERGRRGRGTDPARPGSRDLRHRSRRQRGRVLEPGHGGVLARCPRGRHSRYVHPLMRKWIPIIILASGQFVMTLDTSVMNVSISQITADLNTSIQGVQAAITLYALVMAALMLTGAKLGDIYGRNRMFAIGLGVYGVGSLITALSPNLTVLLVGWSGIEGLGAIMVIPGIAALTAANYEGKDRAVAYALIGGITAVAVAAGPLIGGWVTTNASWRYVFAGETVIVTVIILLRGQIAQAPKAEHRPKMDYRRFGALRRRPRDWPSSGS